MKLAVVTPRYGRDVVGGAETAARLLATRLAARADWDVEVLTTDALDNIAQTTLENIAAFLAGARGGALPNRVTPPK